MKIHNKTLFTLFAISAFVFVNGCVGFGGKKSTNEKKIGELSNSSITKDAKRDTSNITATEKKSSPDISNGLAFIREINDKAFELKLSGNFYKTFKFEDQEYPLEVKEVYPGIVYYDKYDSMRILPYHQEDSIWSVTRVKDKVEFYDADKLVNTIILDSINPYLKRGTHGNIMKHFSDAEGTDVLANRDPGKDYSIDSYHLTQNVQNQGPYTIINFWNHEISDGWIVNTPTTILILDSLGQEVFNQEYERHMSVPAIDLRAKYLMIAFSGVETVNTSGAKVQSDGFEIWQIQPKKILHLEVNKEENMSVSTPVFVDNTYLKINFSYPNSKDTSQLIFAFKHSTKELGYRVFLTKEWEEISLNWFKKYKTHTKLFSKYPLELKNINHGN